jgi:hypothetical protein
VQANRHGQFIAGPATNATNRTSAARRAIELQAV